MDLNLSWFKTTALSAVQHASSVLLTCFGGDAADLWSIEWHRALGLAGGTALVSVLAAVVAYSLPNQKATAAVSVGTAAVQSAQDVESDTTPPVR
jgi:fructose-specific phosphotransferase system IIC component